MIEPTPEQIIEAVRALDGRYAAIERRCSGPPPVAPITVPKGSGAAPPVRVAATARARG